MVPARALERLDLAFQPFNTPVQFADLRRILFDLPLFHEIVALSLEFAGVGLVFTVAMGILAARAWRGVVLGRAVRWILAGVLLACLGVTPLALRYGDYRGLASLASPPAGEDADGLPIGVQLVAANRPA